MNTQRKYILASMVTLGLLCLLAGCQQPANQKSSVMASYDESTITTLLNKAQIAFQKGQLTTPEHDNALSYYQKVLVIDPQRPQALSGREAIFDRYLDYARTAYNNRDFNKALAMVDKAEQVLLPSKMSKALRQQILAEQKRVANAPKPVKKKIAAAPQSTGVEYLLSIKGLTDKDDKIRERLKLIAEHAQELNNSVLIIARNDAEGRWIYQQMKQAVPAYRLRGDIHISEHPKVVLMQMIQ